MIKMDKYMSKVIFYWPSKEIEQGTKKFHVDIDTFEKF